MAQIKGSALASTLRFIEERYGEAGLAQIVGALHPEQRTTIDFGVLVSSWYPFAIMLQLMRETSRRLAGGSPQVYREMGRFSADYSLTTLYRAFFRLGSPQFTLALASRVWSSYYDTGRMVAIVNEKGHAVLELSGFGEPAPEFCERVLGWLERTVELNRGRELRSSHIACVNRGDPTCRFEGFWS